MIKIGSDPEFFLSEGNIAVSAHDLLPGTKENPYPVSGGAIQVDGTAVEYNINAADNVDQFVSNHLEVQKHIREFLDKARPGLVFNFVPVRNYPSAYFKAIPRSARILGCDPDFNAYTGNQNIMYLDENTAVRTAAGHVHIGWTSGVDVRDADHFWRCQLMCRVLDKLVLTDYNAHLDQANVGRQRYYGAAGSFRPKSYGVEYRSLSNVWCAKPERMAWVYDRVKRAVDLLISGKVPAAAMTAPSYGSVENSFWPETRKAWASDLKLAA